MLSQIASFDWLGLNRCQFSATASELTPRSWTLMLAEHRGLGAILQGLNPIFFMFHRGCNSQYIGTVDL